MNNIKEKEEIIIKINQVDDEALLSEIRRVLEADSYVFSDSDIHSIKEADDNISMGNYVSQDQLKKNMHKWWESLK